MENRRITAAREKTSAALNSDAIMKLRQDVNDQAGKYNTLIKKLTADSDDAARLKTEYDEVRAKIAALRAQAQ